MEEQLSYRNERYQLYKQELAIVKENQYNKLANYRNDIYREIVDYYNVPENLVYRDIYKNRIEIAPWILDQLKEKIEGKKYIVEEYPTWDRTEVEREEL